MAATRAQRISPGRSWCSADAPSPATRTQPRDARALLARFAAAKAFASTEVEHDAYFALKRTLLPTVVTYAILRDGFDAPTRAAVEAWLDPLVRAVDRKFDGDVDVNNHRYLADAVLTRLGQPDRRRGPLCQGRRSVTGRPSPRRARMAGCRSKSAAVRARCGTSALRLPI